MKKLLVAIMALTMINAFADNHGGHSMIMLDGCFDDGRCDTLDFRMASDTDENNDDADAESEQTIALNYAHNFGMWGVGARYVTSDSTTDGDVTSSNQDMNFNMMGLSVYWNKDGSWSDSCFAALHYDMTSVEDTEATDDSGWNKSDITLEYGHRYALGKAMMGVQVNYVPSVEYRMGTIEYNDSDADNDTDNELRLNFANFAAVF